MNERRVSSGEVTLAVREYGDPDLPTLVAVHGYPDSQDMWATFAGHVADDLRVVTYDVRGGGRSSAPSTPAGYRTERLVDDLVAVLDATCPDGPVHLLGHDWGSIQLWDAVTSEETDERLRGRIATFTSISGPSLDHVGLALRRASRPARLRQARRSWYVYAFHVPYVPELVWRRLHRTIGAGLARSQRIPPEAEWGDELARDAANGLQLYRANIRHRVRRPRHTRTRVPVQLVVPRYDPWVTPLLLAPAEESAEALQRVEIAAGHWVPRTHPQELAGLVADWTLPR